MLVWLSPKVLLDVSPVEILKQARQNPLAQNLIARALTYGCLGNIDLTRDRCGDSTRFLAQSSTRTRPQLDLSRALGDCVLSKLLI